MGSANGGRGHDEYFSTLTCGKAAVLGASHGIRCRPQRLYIFAINKQRRVSQQREVVLYSFRVLQGGASRVVRRSAPRAAAFFRNRIQLATSGRSGTRGRRRRRGGRRANDDGGATRGTHEGEPGTETLASTQKITDSLFQTNITKKYIYTITENALSPIFTK